MAYQFYNNASSVLTGDIGPGDTTVNITHADAGKYPIPSGDSFFVATLVKTTGEFEIVKATANPLDGSFTIERGVEGTEAISFVIGDYFEHRLTAGALNAFPQKDGTLQSGLNAQKVNSIEASTVATANSLLALDADGDFDVDIKGNAAGTATALETARTISISGDATGSASFDGTTDTDIEVTLSGSSKIAVVSGTTYTYIPNIIDGTASNSVAVNKTYYISQRLEGSLTVSWSNANNDPSDFFDIYFNEVRQVHDSMDNDDSNNGTFDIDLVAGINSIRVQFYAGNNDSVTYNVDLKSDTDVNLAILELDGGLAP